MFKRVMKWEATVQFFTQYGILEVYEAFEKLTEVIDSIITFNRTSIYYDIENFDDYQENVDWWVVTYSQEF